MKDIPPIIKYWKYLQIFNVAGALLFLVFNFVLKNLLIIHSNFVPINSVITFIFIIFSLTIIYGISKRRIIGFYSSLLYIIFLVIFNITELISFSAYTLMLFLVYGGWIILNLIFGYYVYKERKYFKISNIFK